MKSPEAVVEHEVVIAGGEGEALPVREGHLLRITDVEGQQVADFVAFATQDRREWLSPTHTRSALLRLNLRVGDRLESNWRRPMLEVLHDDVGMHDLITSMCDARRYVLDYGVEGHRSCRDNLTEAFSPWGICEWQIPDPFNLFQNAPILEDRSFGNQAPTSRPGDSIVFRVLMDVIVGVSACPQDLNLCNGFHPSPIRVQILNGTLGS